jgi:hypothetical protein
MMMHCPNATEAEAFEDYDKRAEATLAYRLMEQLIALL